MDLASAFSALSEYVGLNHWFGYLVVAAAAFLETIPFTGLFVPSNIIMVLAGIFAYEGYLRTGTVLFIAITAGTLGDVFSYWLGRKYNHNFSARPLAAKKAYFEKTERFFERYGGKSVFAARFVAPLRPFIAFIAGAAKMPFPKFLGYSVASTLIWATAFFSLGFALEGSLDTALAWIDRIDRVMFAMVIAAGAAFLFHRYALPRLRAKKPVFDPKQ